MPTSLSWDFFPPPYVPLFPLDKREREKTTEQKGFNIVSGENVVTGYVLISARPRGFEDIFLEIGVYKRDHRAWLGFINPSGLWWPAWRNQKDNMTAWVDVLLVENTRRQQNRPTYAHRPPALPPMSLTHWGPRLGPSCAHVTCFGGNNRGISVLYWRCHGCTCYMCDCSMRGWRCYIVSTGRTAVFIRWFLVRLLKSPRFF